MKKVERWIMVLLVAITLISSSFCVVAATKYASITAQLRDDITIEYNGRATELYDANGNRVYPIMYNGTTYIPVRASATLLGISVDWSSKDSKIILKSK